MAILALNRWRSGSKQLNWKHFSIVVRVEAWWGELSGISYPGGGFIQQSFTKYVILTLIFVWHEVLRGRFNSCFWRAFC